MKPGWAITGRTVTAFAAALTAGALAAGLSACGGSGTAGGTPAGSSFLAPDLKVLTPPGTHLKIGQSAIVGYVPISGISLKPQHGYRLQVTVESIRKGRVADFPSDALNARERKSTPYYVKTRIKALGGNPLKKKDYNPAQAFDAVDYHGEQPEKFIFLGGGFPPCNTTEVPKNFVNGKSYESCMTFLMPVGGPPPRLQWSIGPHEKDETTPYFDKPLLWASS
ncbi:MAG: hypothetical protein ABJB47_01285 [Actinomycetota bacterium]